MPKIKKVAKKKEIVEGSVMDRLRKTTTIKEASILEDSKFFNAKDMIVTEIPILNVALSGSICGGMVPGLTLWAGPSKHFKTSFALIELKAFMDKYEDGICLFYDSEFGTPQSYFTGFGIPLDRVFHTPLTDIEQLKFDIMQQMRQLTREDKVMIVIDSVGNLASKKEVEDALEGSSKADMTRAKQLKSLFRMVTPYLNLKDIPMVVVNHTYKTQELYAKDVVSGGTGIYYSADNIFILGRQQDKDGKELNGYNFIINVEKSRFVREKSKIPIAVSFETGISKWSGLLPLALEFGMVTKPKLGWYTRPEVSDDKNWREDATDCAEFWLPILENPAFDDECKRKFQLDTTAMLQSMRDKHDEIAEEA